MSGQFEKVYREELQIADELMGWRQRWHPRGDAAQGAIKRGLGLSLHTWGGRGHRSNCEVTIHPDGIAEAKIATQDLGTGTRTVIAIVLADSLGLPLDGVKVSIGDSRYPASGGSGGSTTVGGVSSATRRAAQNALVTLFAKAAPELGAKPEELEAAEGKIRVKADPGKSLTWTPGPGALRPARRSPPPAPIPGRGISPPAASAACRWPTSRWTSRPASSASTRSWRCRTAA